VDDKYSINQQSVNNLLTWINTGTVAIPEIQRPFVWSPTQVRNLMDSLYKGYPVGYIITWQNSSVRLKDGSLAVGKKVLIDGQQRLTALRAAISGLPVMTKRYDQKRIIISFNPRTEEFATQTPVIRKDKEWIADIAEAMSIDFDSFSFIEAYCAKNDEPNKSLINKRLTNLIQIKNKQIGEIQLSQTLDIDVVNEIFVRINASGVALSNADFVMSKIAVYEREVGDEFGMRLRKFIDYFCNLAVAPSHFTDVQHNDKDFAQSPYFKQIAWLKDDTDNLYDPTYNDILRVVSLTHFERGRLGDLVALLSGRDFEKRDNFKEIADRSFDALAAGVTAYTNQYRFKSFVQDILRGAAFDEPSMFVARNAINYAYAIYLRLCSVGEDPAATISLTRRLFVISLLTGRHSGSFETRFEADIKLIQARGDMASFVATLERDTFTDTYWNLTLPDAFDRAKLSNAYWHIFVAAQKKLKKQSFLTDIAVSDLAVGDIHHIFPKAYLIKHGFNETEYNKIANFVYLHTAVNIRVGDREPADYIGQVEDGGAFGSHWTDIASTRRNFEDNAIPIMLESATYHDYTDFLKQRQVLMAQMVRAYYSLL